jgi:hypothetical protein
MSPKNQLPTELSELEALLANRDRQKAPEHLRMDVLNDVRAELSSPLQSNNWWSFVAGVAACLLLTMNLAIASVNVSDYPRNRSANTADVDETTRLLRDLLPELSPEQARQHSITLTRARLSPLR